MQALPQYAGLIVRVLGSETSQLSEFVMQPTHTHTPPPHTHTHTHPPTHTHTHRAELPAPRLRGNLALFVLYIAAAVCGSRSLGALVAGASKTWTCPEGSLLSQLHLLKVRFGEVGARGLLDLLDTSLLPAMRRARPWNSDP